MSSVAEKYHADQTLASIRANRISGDVTLICEGKELKAHSLILSNTSEYFKTALTTDLKKTNRIEIKNCKASTLSVVIDFVYGIDIPTEFEDLIELLDTAEMFLIDQLKEEAGRLLGTKLTRENYIDMGRVGEKYRVKSLTKSCARFIFNTVKLQADWDAIEDLHMVNASLAKMLALYYLE